MNTFSPIYLNWLTRFYNQKDLRVIFLVCAVWRPYISHISHRLTRANMIAETLRALYLLIHYLLVNFHPIQTFLYFEHLISFHMTVICYTLTVIQEHKYVTVFYMFKATLFLRSWSLLLLIHFFRLSQA